MFCPKHCKTGHLGALRPAKHCKTRDLGALGPKTLQNRAFGASSSLNLSIKPLLSGLAAGCWG
eukprot:6071638-Amphidinium_carterae.1